MKTKPSNNKPVSVGVVNVGLDRVSFPSPAGFANRARTNVARFLIRLAGVRALSVSLPAPALGESQAYEVRLVLGSAS